MFILGIETSCDETSISVVEATGKSIVIRYNLVSSQVKLHLPFGGVLPELATREHLKNLPKLVSQLFHQKENGIDWPQIEAIAVTDGPGLAPALLIGHAYARGLGIALDKPVYGINHLEGHLFSPFLSAGKKIEFPFVGLIVSGGHTLLLHVLNWNHYVKLGGTVDDAAGEAFDKIARLLGLPYPGGPLIEKLAQKGNPYAYDFPQSFPEKENFNFSFSGLKTAVRYFFEKNPQHHQNEQWRADLAASFQRAIIETLSRKAIHAVEVTHASRLVASGGVLCNINLQHALSQQCKKRGVDLLLAPMGLCTDNAAMIAAVAAGKFLAGISPQLSEDIDPNLSLFCSH
jgi:N6-L-threonylcarbamoyladenine synthase